MMGKFVKTLLGTLALTAIIFGAVIYGIYRSLPTVTSLRHQYPAVEYKPQNQSFTIRMVKNRPAQWVRLSQISPFVPAAFIVSEDWSFFSHSGVDFDEIQKMLEDHFEEGERLRGASTITQQVAKNVFLTQEKTLTRKLKEIVLALEIEKTLGKKDILEIYCNIVELGPGVYGVRQAAKYYFAKEPSELDPKEAAFLAMLLPNPKKYSQSFRDQKLTPYAEKTVDRVLEKMLKAGYLEEAQYELAQDERLSFERDAQKTDESSGTLEPLNVEKQSLEQLSI